MKKSVFLIVVFLSFKILNAQNVFSRIYYADTNIITGIARANTVIHTSDGGYLLSGTSNNLALLFAIKTNNIGDTIWSFKCDLGIGGGDYITTSIETIDGNYIIGGATRDASVPSSAAFLIKLNNLNGDTLWTRKIGLLNLSERCYNIKPTSDGGFAFCGVRYTNSTGTSSDVYLVKTDSMGIPQWERTYGGADYDFGNSLDITVEGGYMILGTTYSYGVGAYNMYLIKTDSIGNMLWQKTYGGNLEDYGTSIIKTNDGGYALAGGTYVSTDSITNYLVKIDTAGIVQWEKRYRGISKYAEITGIQVLPTGEIVVAGDMQGDDLNYTYYGTLKKLNDNDGSIIWQKQYHYFNTDTTQHYFYAMDVCTDGGFVMAGM